MPRLIKYTLTAILVLASLLASPSTSSAQPLRAKEPGNALGKTPHLFLPTHFLHSICKERYATAQMRLYYDEYLHNHKHKDYPRALAYCDSLIRKIEQQKTINLRLAICYKDRAHLLKQLNHDSDACRAYHRAIIVHDSLTRRTQTETARETQEAYELARLELDHVQLEAQHHNTTLKSLALLLLAVIGTTAFVILNNRRTKRLQHKLRHRMHQARKSEEQKMSFINSMCHEVRTPLNCIAGFSELLATAENDPSAREDYCAIIEENRRQLSDQLDTLLKVAFLENHPEQLPRTPFDVAALCRRQVESLQPKAGLKFICQIPDHEVQIPTDSQHLEQVVAALLDNAVKFTDGGAVRLFCTPQPGGGVQIAVEDTGCGIPTDQHADVFGRFVKLDTFSPGNGLGLYLSRMIVQRLGGQIAIDPAYQAGTRIVLTLPGKE